MNKFFALSGPMAIGSRLRQLSERITQESARVYAAYQVGLEPRWLPVFYLLAQEGPCAVGDIAAACGQSQPSVSQIVRDMAAQDLLLLERTETDGRKTLVRLTDKGMALLPALRLQIADVGLAVQSLLDESAHDLWQALEGFETALDRQNLAARTDAIRKQRESEDVIIRPFGEQDRAAFRTLNMAWIQTHFEMEPEDYKQLDHPEEILAQGGVILMAQLGQTAVGSCALIPMEPGSYELIKLAVSPHLRGRHIGWKLGQAIVAHAKQRGAQRLFLESNTKLKAAISLYRKLGFSRVAATPSPFKRCDIQMELRL